MSKYCMSCGAANSDAASVCTRCGKALSGRGGTIPRQTNNSGLELVKKLMSEKRTRYGIGIAVLCVVIILVFVAMSNKGIVGTWESDEIISGDYHVSNTIIFKKDNTGYITTKNLEGGDEGTCSFQWSEIEDNKYLITCETENKYFSRELREITIEVGSNEFVIEPRFFSVDETNIVYHRK